MKSFLTSYDSVSQKIEGFFIIVSKNGLSGKCSAGVKVTAAKKLVGNLMTASENPAFSTSTKNSRVSGCFRS